jgi:hypothetical protein
MSAISESPKESNTARPANAICGICNLHFSSLSLFWNKFWDELIGHFPWHDTDRIEDDVSNSSSIVACVFVAAVTFLPSRCLATIRGIHIYTHILMGGIYEVRRWDGLRCHDIHTKFHKDWLSHSKVHRADTHTCTQTALWSHKPTFTFSK